MAGVPLITPGTRDGMSPGTLAGIHLGTEDGTTAPGTIVTALGDTAGIAIGAVRISAGGATTTGAGDTTMLIGAGPDITIHTREDPLTITITTTDTQQDNVPDWRPTAIPADVLTEQAATAMASRLAVPMATVRV